MARTICIAIIALSFVIIFQVLPISGQEEQKAQEWTGKLKDGQLLTKNMLENILADHKKYREAMKEDEGIPSLAWYRKWLPYKASLYGADLRGADLSEADLSLADLSGADLRGASLRGADLSEASLSGADLSGASLYGAGLREADLSYATFQPYSLPSIRDIAFALNLSKMKYSYSRQALTELREGFKKAGLRKQEREITYAINHTQRKKLWNDQDSSVLNMIESSLYLVFFELTCAYGMSPGRLFLILVGFIFVFTIPYTVWLSIDSEDGIWVVWIEDRVRKDLGRKEPFRLKGSGWSTLKWGFYFSLLSAFSIGWRDINVGNWIARMQRREYVLKPTGWVRTVSGIQSLLSVYLLALWVLTYFGRPFEAV